MKINKTITLARQQAPEDITPGSYVAVIRIVTEFISPKCFFEQHEDSITPTRITWLPCDEAEPLRVTAVCLPFVLVETPRGKPKTLDVRQHVIARLDKDFARQAVEAYAKRRKK